MRNCESGYVFFILKNNSTSSKVFFCGFMLPILQNIRGLSLFKSCDTGLNKLLSTPLGIT